MTVVKREAMKAWMTYEGPAKRPEARRKHPTASEPHVRSHKAAAKVRARESAKAASKMGRAKTAQAAMHPSKTASKAAMHSPEAASKAAEPTSGSRSRYGCTDRQGREAAEKLAFHSQPSNSEVKRRAVATPRDATEGSGKTGTNPLTNKSFSDKKVSFVDAHFVTSWTAGSRL
ncbi:MAG: hypothetical protein ACR652_11190 [Methylocystis sp.]|uniref:hypothetical protein n=1 Tax=Methylocystis sp. TaxID=1911079 RepID=UPI003DA30FD8